jgi:hypothetical protein
MTGLNRPTTKRSLQDLPAGGALGAALRYSSFGFGAFFFAFAVLAAEMSVAAEADWADITPAAIETDRSAANAAVTRRNGFLHRWLAVVVG